MWDSAMKLLEEHGLVISGLTNETIANHNTLLIFCTTNASIPWAEDLNSTEITDMEEEEYYQCFSWYFVALSAFVILTVVAVLFLCCCCCCCPESCGKCLRVMAVTVLGTIALVVGLVATPLAIAIAGCLGFTAAGVAARSCAAGAQPPNVESGSVFSRNQRLGAIGKVC